MFHAIVVDATAVVFDFDVDVIAAVISAEGDFAWFGFAGAARRRELDAVGDGVADQVHERIGNLLDDVVVELGFVADEVEFDLLAGGLGGVANGARQAGIESADGHHARGGEFVLQVVRELGEFVDVAFDAADVAFELRQHFVDVGGNFGHGAGEDVEIVVAIHLEFAEVVEKLARPRRRWLSNLLSGGVRPRHGGAGGADAVELVFFLEFVDFALQAFLGEAERVDEFFEFGDAADHAGAVDDQFADGVHHAVEAFESDANGLGGSGLLAVCLAGLSGRTLRRCDLNLVSGFGFLIGRLHRFFFGVERSEFRDAIEQRIDAVAHFGLVGPLAMQCLFQNVDGFEADVDDGRRWFDFAVAQAANQIFDAMSDGAEPPKPDLSGGALYRVDGAEQAIDFFGIVVAFEGDQAIADDL